MLVYILLFAAQISFASDGGRLSRPTSQEGGSSPNIFFEHVYKLTHFAASPSHSRVQEDFEPAKTAPIKEIKGKGVKSWRDAEIILLADHHGDLETNFFNFEVISKIAKEGDVILFEGPHPGGLPCSNTALNLLLPKPQLFRAFEGYAAERDHAHFSEIWLDLHCESWDDIETFWRSIRLNHLGQVELAHANMGSNPFETMFRLIKDRNAFLIENIKKAKKPGRRVFVIAGAGHLLRIPYSYAFKEKPTRREEELYNLPMDQALDGISKFLEEEKFYLPLFLKGEEQGGRECPEVSDPQLPALGRPKK